jgi:hypothetical protein
MEIAFHIPAILLHILFYVFLVVVGVVIGVVGFLWWLTDFIHRGQGRSPWWW